MKRWQLFAMGCAFGALACYLLCNRGIKKISTERDAWQDSAKVHLDKANEAGRSAEFHLHRADSIHRADSVRLSITPTVREVYIGFRQAVKNTSLDSLDAIIGGTVQ